MSQITMSQLPNATGKMMTIRKKNEISHTMPTNKKYPITNRPNYSLNKMLDEIGNTGLSYS